MRGGGDHDAGADRARAGPGVGLGLPTTTARGAGRRAPAVVFAGETIADTTRGLRVLETSRPPAYYFPRKDVRMELLELAAGTTYCELKGEASYFAIRVGGSVARRAAWTMGW